MKRKYISALVGLGAAAVIAVPGVASASTTAVQHMKPATTQGGWGGDNNWGWGNNWGGGGNWGWDGGGWGQNNWWFWHHHHHHHWGW